MDSALEQKLVVDYEDGFLVTDLSQRYSVSIRTVYRVLSKHEVKRRHNPRKKRRPVKRNPRNLHPCGTDGAYQRHRRKVEYPCTQCLEAHALYNKENRS